MCTMSAMPTWYARRMVYTIGMANRYRLYPGKGQAEVLLRHCSDARFVWNLAVEQESWWWPGRDSAPDHLERSRQLTEARASEPWLREGSSNVQQQALRDFDHAMAAFFDPKNPAGKPSFRSKRWPQGFVIRDTKVRRLNGRWAEVFVPKCGYVRFRWTRALPEKLGMARVIVDRTGRWHVSFPAPQPALDRQPTGAVVGIDRGVRTALVTSDGQHYRAPRISDRRAARYLALQRRMARQHKGSAKRERTRRAMARITAHVTDRRKDWAEKVSTRLVQDHDLIVFEKLNTPGMARKPKPKAGPGPAGRVPAERGPREGRPEPGHPRLGVGCARYPRRQKAAASGAAVVLVDPRFTSQQCRVCGHIASANRESQAVFRCVECGHADHADVNAARNILARGLALAAVSAQAPGLWGVRPQSARASGSGNHPERRMSAPGGSQDTLPALLKGDQR